MEPTMKSPAEITAEDVRAALLTIEDILTKGKEVHAATPHGPTENRGEVMANLTIAFRAVEDARMRLGKVFQALNGGISNNTR